MSKRPFKPIGFGGGPSKIPRLEVTISEHQFPLSQNGPKKSSFKEQDLWGDEHEDDLLLQASQVYEQNDLSVLPDYSQWQNAPSSSTQMMPPTENDNIQGAFQVARKDSGYQSFRNQDGAPKPTTVHNQFVDLTKEDSENFKRPALTSKTGGSNLQFKEPNTKYSASRVDPLRELSSSLKENVAEDSFVMNNLKDSEKFYRRLLQVQEENAKLKSENSRLLEQALSKDGEVTILRGRLKSCQAAVDGARMEKLQASEKMQLEWSEKLAVSNKDANGLRTQLDCKELEVARMRERCKLLESNKVKLNSTQFNSSQRINVNFCEINGSFIPPPAKNKHSTSVQTDRNNASIILHPAYRSKPNDLSEFVPLLLEPTVDQPSVFHELDTDYGHSRYRDSGSCPNPTIDKRSMLDLTVVYENMSELANVKDWDSIKESMLGKCLNIVNQVKLFLKEVLRGLEEAASKMTAAFQRAMDAKYLWQLRQYTNVETRRLYSGEALFKDEQQIVCRRAAAALASLCEKCAILRQTVRSERDGVVALMTNVTERISAVSCAVQYSGVLLSFVLLVKRLLPDAEDAEALANLTRHVLLSRPSLVVVASALPVLRLLSVRERSLDGFCMENAGCNLKLDSDQGLLTYSKDSCFLQVLLTQVETCLKCAEGRGDISALVWLGGNLLSLYQNARERRPSLCSLTGEISCRCPVRFAQVLVYMLQICARKLHEEIEERQEPGTTRDLLPICRVGLNVVTRWTLCEYDLRALDRYTGRCHSFVDLCLDTRPHVILDEIQDQVLSELVSAFRQTSEDSYEPSEPAKTVWDDSFSRFHITD